MSTDEHLQKVVARMGDLPAMPGIVVRVMEATMDPNVSVSEVCALIEHDPSMTAKLLKVSNSSYFGMRQVVGSLKLALVILGVREVRNIVLGISVFEALRTRETEFLLSNQGLWSHSVLVGGVAKKLGNHLEMSMQGEDFIAGLLHDIGKLVLWNQLGDEYKVVYEKAKELAIPLDGLEMETFEFDHSDAAEALAVAWSLPESLSSALAYHHAREGRSLSDSASPKLSALVRVANLAAHDKWNGKDEGTLWCGRDDEAWKILELDSGEQSIEDRENLMMGFVNELKESPTLSL